MIVEVCGDRLPASVAAGDAESIATVGRTEFETARVIDRLEAPATFTAVRKSLESYLAGSGSA